MIPRSGRFAAIVLQQAAQTFLAFDGARNLANFVTGLDDLIAQPVRKKNSAADKTESLS